MNDFKKYKIGDIVTLTIETIIVPQLPTGEIQNSYSKNVTSDFLLLSIAKRGEDFIFVFERSNVFDTGVTYDSDSESYCFIQSFILDTSDLKWGYIKFLNKTLLQRKFEAENCLLQIIYNNKIKHVKKLKEELEKLNNEAKLFSLEPNSIVEKVNLLNKITDIKHQIQATEEMIITINNELQSITT